MEMDTSSPRLLEEAVNERPVWTSNREMFVWALGSRLTVDVWRVVKARASVCKRNGNALEGDERAELESARAVNIVTVMDGY